MAPVARRDAPSSVPKNQYSTAIMAAVNSPTVTMGCRQRGSSPLAAPWTKRRDTRRRSRLAGSMTLMATLAFIPIMDRLTDHSPSWVRIPARMAGMPQAVWSRPVTSPASIPARMAHRVAIQMLTPLRASSTQAAPPVAREPSTVRSATSRIL